MTFQRSAPRAAAMIGGLASLFFRAIATGAGVSEFDNKLLMNHAIPRQPVGQSRIVRERGS
jgi:hypothetical protein